MTKLKKFRAWVIKNKKANHIVRSGIYEDEQQAMEEYEDMPVLDNGGCGKRDDYEIVEVIVTRRNKT